MRAAAARHPNLPRPRLTELWTWRRYGGWRGRRRPGRALRRYADLSGPVRSAAPAHRLRGVQADDRTVVEHRPGTTREKEYGNPTRRLPTAGAARNAWSRPGAGP
ncbi:hypothetical protein [Streptomyces mirabilis]|uniref:hypothetical protein n=1 Tax=Streptomyces mirabilis TaxID=68239 RepID=UPI0033CBF320